MQNVLNDILYRVSFPRLIGTECLKVDGNKIYSAENLKVGLFK